MSKADLRQHLLSAPTGTTPGGIIAALRAQGVQMEGDPQAARQVQTRTPNAFSFEGQQQLEQQSPLLGPLAQPFKEAANFGINAFNMGKQAIMHPYQTVDSAMGTLAGGAVDATLALTKATGGAVPNIIGKDQQMFRGAVDQYATNYGVKNFANAGGQLLHGNVTGALQSTTAGINDINKTLFESPAQATMDYYGAKGAISSGLKGLGATDAATAVDNFHPADAFLSDVVGPIVDKTPLIGRLTRNLARGVDPIIDTGINKGIRTTVSGKDTLAQRTNYAENSRTAVKAIVHNKDNLQLNNEFGEPLPQGSLPKNLDQFSQALDQTKKQIFTEYNDLQKQAGAQGIKVDLKPIVEELNRLAEDPTIQDTAPAVAEYAKARARAFEARGVYDPEQAQSAAATLNARIQAFNKNPNPNDLSANMVDALIKNKLVDGVDNAVMEATNSADYMPLRQQYAGLKAIEKDLNHRAVVFARQSNKGFFDLSNVFSYGDVVHGLSTGNVPLVAKGLVQKGIASYYKYLNNPNTIVKGMFEGVDKVINQGGDTLSPPVIPEPMPQFGEGQTSPPTLPESSLPVKSSLGLPRDGAKKGGGTFVNPIDPSLTPKLKAKALIELSQKNKPSIDSFLKEVDDLLGTSSEARIKTDQSILDKSNREGLAVEQLRDGLGFRTSLNSSSDFNKIVNLVESHGWEIIKKDTNKMFAPKEWGWRFGALDIRLPNGQLVEYYMSPSEMIKAQAVTHPLYKKWRNVSKSDRLKDPQFFKDLAASNETYQSAWAAALKRLGLDDASASASWRKASASGVE